MLFFFAILPQFFFSFFTVNLEVCFEKVNDLATEKGKITAIEKKEYN